MPRDEFTSFAILPSSLQPEPEVPSEPPIIPPPDEDDDLAVEVVSPFYATQLDEVSETVTYLGKADPGADTSWSVWQIQRITTVGEDLVIEWASGTAEFDKIWDNRLGYSYS